MKKSLALAISRLTEVCGQQFVQAKQTGYCLTHGAERSKATKNLREAWYLWCREYQLPFIWVRTTQATLCVYCDCITMAKTQEPQPEVCQWIFREFSQYMREEGRPTKRDAVWGGSTIASMTLYSRGFTETLGLRLSYIFKVLMHRVPVPQTTLKELRTLRVRRLSDVMPKKVKRITHFTRSNPMAIQLYRDENGYAMQTSCATESEFLSQAAELFADLIDKGSYTEHWQTVLQAWLPQLVNICCAYRGYKTPEVAMRTLYTAGKLPQADIPPVHRITDAASRVASALALTNGHEEGEPVHG